MSRAALISIVFVVLFVAFVVSGTLASKQLSCEVCITYRGHKKCRTANGDDREATISMATDNACAFLASGRTQLIQCTSAPPTTVECREK